ncbi:MAG: hypothetical protein ACLPKT_23845 [Methylocella sp.]
MNQQLKELARRSQVCWRLMSVPGVGPTAGVTNGHNHLPKIIQDVKITNGCEVHHKACHQTQEAAADPAHRSQKIGDNACRSR